MTLDYAKYQTATHGFRALFNKTLDSVDSPAEELGMEVESDSESEDYHHMGSVPGLQRWLDERPMSSLRHEKISIENHNWASGLKLNANKVKDDKLGQIRMSIEDLARKARQSAGYTIGGMLLNGHAAYDGPERDFSDGLAYDGQNFFDDDHADTPDMSSQSNLLTSALSQAVYRTARAQMISYVDEHGRNLGIIPNLLCVGPSNEGLAKEIVAAETIPNTAGTASQSNVMRDTARVLILTNLVGSYANYWFLADTRYSARPIIYQKREAVSFAAMDNIRSSEDLFMRNDLKYGAQARYGFGYSLWQLILGSTGAS